MTGPVKTPRRYDASRRQDQAHQNRAAVLAAARELFLADGYPATTMAAVARAAGVSSQLVYKTFGNKPGLVKALFDVAIAGDDEPVRMLDRESLARVRAEPDPHVKLRLYADFVAGTSAVRPAALPAAGPDHLFTQSSEQRMLSR